MFIIFTKIFLLISLLFSYNPKLSVHDFSKEEPEMAENANHVQIRVGSELELSLPVYMMTEGIDITEGDIAFVVHQDDVHIAQIVNQNDNFCTIRGLQLGSARIIVTKGGQSATIVIAVSPNQQLYTLPAGMVRRLGEAEFYEAWWHSNNPDPLPTDFRDYNAEPTQRLAWIFRNPTTSLGASGPNCGFDILGYFIDPTVPNRRGWVRTTFGHGGWRYDLNGVTNKMTNGVQIEGDVKLEIIPEFFYDKGTPYLQVTHKLTNTGTTRLTGQKFGASADVMIYGADDAPVYNLSYGALMTNETIFNNITYLPTMKLRLVCQNIRGLNKVSTLWIGEYGIERNFVYEDRRDPITAEMKIDSALNFSYQYIDLNPNETKTYTIRFTSVQ